MRLSPSSNQAEQLAELALAAATEIDRLERKRPANIDKIQDFANALSGFDTASELDPASSQMFGVAVSDARRSSVTSMAALNNELEKLTNQFREVSPIQKGMSAPGDLLSHLKRFCLSVNEMLLQNTCSHSLNERGVFDYDFDFTG